MWRCDERTNDTRDVVRSSSHRLLKCCGTDDTRASSSERERPAPSVSAFGASVQLGQFLLAPLQLRHRMPARYLPHLRGAFLSLFVAVNPVTLSSASCARPISVKAAENTPMSRNSPSVSALQHQIMRKGATTEEAQSALCV